MQFVLRRAFLISTIVNARHFKGMTDILCRILVYK